MWLGGVWTNLPSNYVLGSGEVQMGWGGAKKGGKMITSCLCSYRKQSEPSGQFSVCS